MGITPKDPAHFDPAMGNYNDLRPFRFWCQKVLPLVYDDSLSYYEVLCKVVDYLNKTMEDVGVLHEDVDALHTAYQQLQSYVNDYFSTVDVQEEINNKLDVMAEDGTLDKLLLPYFNLYKSEINGIVNTQNDKISVLEGRMDSFARLPDGSTTGDAELIDIRVGVNGTTYPTAGDAVRAQAVQNPQSILGLTEVTEHKDSMYYAVSNGEGGVVKMSTNTPTPPYNRLMSDFNLNTEYLSLSKPTTGYIDIHGDVNSEATWWTYTTVRLEDINATYYANGYSWYGNVKPFIFITDTNKIIYPNVDGGETELYYDYIPFNIFEAGTLYLNRYGTTKIINAYKKTIISEKSSAYGFEKLIDFHNEMINTLYLTRNENIQYDEKLVGYLLDGDTGQPRLFETVENSPYIVEKYSINAFDTYHIKSSHWFGNAIFSIFDENNRLLYKVNSAAGGTYTSYDDDYTMPYNATYCYISYVKTHAVGTIVQVLPQITSEDKKYMGKKWIAFGDSLTSPLTLGVNPNYVNYLTDVLGFTTYNKGVGGTGYWKGHSSNEAFYQRAEDFTEDADIITIFGSFNDLGSEDGVSGASILGNYTDDTTDTVCGCINQTLDTLMTKYPSAILGIVAPTPWSNSHDSTAGETYVSKLKQIADYRCIPFLDLYHSSNIRPWDTTFRSLFMRTPDDGAHPNSEGHKRIAVQFIDFINKIFYPY